MQGVIKGYGGNFSTIAYNTPDYLKLAHLERNVYQFAGAKNYHMMQELTRAIKDGDKVLPYRDFKAKAMTILDEFDERYLKIEYQTAVGGAQMASKAVQYAQHPKDLVEYRAAEDDRECPICKPFNGVILPWDHPFWRVAHPLNHFGCRCTTIRLNAGKQTLESDIPGFDTIPKMFRTNLAETGLIYPKDHPYFIGIPKEVKKQINTLVPDRSQDKPKKK
jgi:SPP1 gp7 family putative phage head morphogenesis protein